MIKLALQRKYRSEFQTSEAMPEKFNGRIRIDQVPVEDSQQLESTLDNIVPSLLPLDDLLEWEAHASMLVRLGLQSEAIAILTSQRIGKA